MENYEKQQQFRPYLLKNDSAVSADLPRNTYPRG